VAAPPLTESEIRFLGTLVRRNVSFMIVGLSAAALQGAPVVTQDIDIWFEKLPDPNLVAALREIGAAYVPPFQLNPPMFAGAGSELFDIVMRMDGLGTFSDEMPHTIDVKLGGLTIKVLALDRILASKRAANRPKDRLVIPVLEDSIAAARQAGGTDGSR
jgi:hypothetical protein